MKNRVKKQILSALLVFVVAAPLCAMDNGDKKRLCDDGQESESKAPRLDDEIIDEFHESPLEIAKKEQLGTIPVIILAQGTPVVESKVCWSEIEESFISSDSLKKVLDKYLDAMSHDARGFEYLMLLCFNTEQIEPLQVGIDFIAQYGKPLLKAICANDSTMAEQLLKSGDVVLEKHLFCAIYRKNKELFDLLLQYAQFNLNDDVNLWGMGLCDHIHSVTEQEAFSWLQMLLNHGYHATHNDIVEELNGNDFECFQSLMNSVSDVNTLFEKPGMYNACRENFLLEVIQKGLDYRFVSLLLDKNIPLQNFEDLILKTAANYRSEIGEITYDGRRIMSMLVAAFEVDLQHEHALSILKKVHAQWRLFTYVWNGNRQKVEKWLLKGVDPNMCVAGYSSLVVTAAERNCVDCMPLLLAYGASVSDSMIRRIDHCSDDVKLCMRTLFAIENFPTVSPNNYLLINGRMEDDWSNKRCDYAQIMLQHPKAAQCLLFHSPYQWINDQFPKKIFDGKTNQICEISDEQWLEHKLKTNAQKFDKQGNRKPESQSLYALFTMGNKLTQRLSDKKLSDVVFKTQN